jgi:hypothetical protein
LAGLKPHHFIKGKGGRTILRLRLAQKGRGATFETLYIREGKRNSALRSNFLVKQSALDAANAQGEDKFPQLIRALEELDRNAFQ